MKRKLLPLCLATLLLSSCGGSGSNNSGGNNPGGNNPGGNNPDNSNQNIKFDYKYYNSLKTSEEKSDYLVNYSKEEMDSSFAFSSNSEDLSIKKTTTNKRKTKNEKFDLPSYDDSHEEFLKVKSQLSLQGIEETAFNLVFLSEDIMSKDVTFDKVYYHEEIVSSQLGRSNYSYKKYAFDEESNTYSYYYAEKSWELTWNEKMYSFSVDENGKMTIDSLSYSYSEKEGNNNTSSSYFHYVQGDYAYQVSYSNSIDNAQYQYLKFNDHGYTSKRGDWIHANIDGQIYSYMPGISWNGFKTKGSFRTRKNGMDYLLNFSPLSSDSSINVINSYTIYTNKNIERFTSFGKSIGVYSPSGTLSSACAKANASENKVCSYEIYPSGLFRLTFDHNNVSNSIYKHEDKDSSNDYLTDENINTIIRKVSLDRRIYDGYFNLIDDYHMISNLEVDEFDENLIKNQLETSIPKLKSDISAIINTPKEEMIDTTIREEKTINSYLSSLKPKKYMCDFIYNEEGELIVELDFKRQFSIQSFEEFPSYKQVSTGAHFISNYAFRELLIPSITLLDENRNTISSTDDLDGNKLYTIDFDLNEIEFYLMSEFEYQEVEEFMNSPETSFENYEFYQVLNVLKDAKFKFNLPEDPYAKAETFVEGLFEDIIQDIDETGEKKTKTYSLENGVEVKGYYYNTLPDTYNLYFSPIHSEEDGVRDEYVSISCVDKNFFSIRYYILNDYDFSFNFPVYTNKNDFSFSDYVMAGQQTTYIHMGEEYYKESFNKAVNIVNSLLKQFYSCSLENFGYVTGIVK